MALVDSADVPYALVQSSMDVIPPILPRIALSLASLSTLALASAERLSVSAFEVPSAGMAIATMIAIIPTAIRISISVNAEFFLDFLDLGRFIVM